MLASRLVGWELKIHVRPNIDLRLRTVFPDALNLARDAAASIVSLRQSVVAGRLNERGAIARFSAGASTSTWKALAGCKPWVFTHKVRR
jgi:hypothetical protein